MTRLRRLAQRIGAGQVGLYGAALAYSFLFALVPLALFAAALAAALHVPSPARLMGAGGAGVVPAAVERVLSDSLGRLGRRSAPAALSLGVLGYLWGMSGAVRQALAAVRHAYDGPAAAAAPWLKTYAASLALSVTLGILLVGAVALTLLGRGALSWLAQRAGLGVPAAGLDAVRWLGVFAVFVAVVALLYRMAPDRPGPVLPGALFALVLWLGASLALNVYAPRLMATSVVYGALGGVILLLLYFYAVGLAVVVGAHVNAAWRPPDAGPAAPGQRRCARRRGGVRRREVEEDAAVPSVRRRCPRQGRA